MVCTTMIVNAVSRKLNPRPSEKRMETRNSSVRIDNRTCKRKTTPAANPNKASEMAAYPIIVCSHHFIAVDALKAPASGGATPLRRSNG